MSKPLSRTDLKKLVQLAEKLEQSGQLEQVLKLYRDWIRHNPKSPVLFVAHFNLGCLSSESGDLAGALASYQAALRHNPNFFQAHINASVILQKLGRPEEAIDALRTATKDKRQAGDMDNLILAYNNLGRLLEDTNRWQEALQVLTRSLELMPAQDKVLYTVVRLRQRICAWPIYAPLPNISTEAMVAQTSAIAMLSITDDPALQREASQRNVQNSFQVIPQPPRISPLQGYRHERLRIGYLSSNFNFHPVSLIAVELFELHDRARFEVFGFSWSPEDGSPMLGRVRKALDHFIPIHQLSDEQAARLIASHEIDILIDLQGLTANARSSILAYRPAPHQINYLGHPGTACIPGVDYIMVDRYVIPEDQQAHYSEQPIYLPGCLQTSDRQRPHPNTAIAERARFGLPADRFVFCCFCNTNKFTPETFATWMRILQRVPESVLWLLADNPAAEANLRRQAQAQGIAAERLVYAGRVDYTEFLARFGVADLFLDTFPCTGGTTINDALWMDLPIVTRSGRSFAARLSGSILSALGLSNYITDSYDAYEELAVRLAQQPELLQTFREALKTNKANSPLFDMPKLVHAIEDALNRLACTQGECQATLPSATPPTAPAEPYLSIIIPTHQRPDWLAQVVRKIYANAGEDVQLIIISDRYEPACQQNVGPLLRVHDLYIQCACQSSLDAIHQLGQQLARSSHTIFLESIDSLPPELMALLQVGCQDR